MLNSVIVTLANNRKIIDTTPFVSDEQFQRVLMDAKKKSCTAKIMRAGDAKHHRDYDLPVAV